MRTEHVDPDGRVVVRDEPVVREAVVADDKALKESYDRGRRDERKSHRRNWLWTIVGALLTVIGAAVLVLAALNGSFQRGGAVIDQQLSIATDRAEPAIRNAAGDAGAAIRDAAADNDSTAAPPSGQSLTTATTDTTTAPAAP